MKISPQLFARGVEIKFREFIYNSETGKTALFGNICLEKGTLP